MTGLSPRQAARRTDRRRRMAGEGVIYVSAVPGTDIIKIGHTLNLPLRIKTVDAYVIGRPGRTELMGAIPAPAWLEHSLHRTLRRDPAYIGNEFYRRDILDHPAIPAGLLRAMETAKPRRRKART